MSPKDSILYSTGIRCNGGTNLAVDLHLVFRYSIFEFREAYGYVNSTADRLYLDDDALDYQDYPRFRSSLRLLIPVF